MYSWFVGITLVLVFLQSLVLTTGIKDSDEIPVHCTRESSKSCGTRNGKTQGAQGQPCNLKTIHIRCTECNSTNATTSVRSSGNTVWKTYYICPTSSISSTPIQTSSKHVGAVNSSGFELVVRPSSVSTTTATESNLRNGTEGLKTTETRRIVSTPSSILTTAIWSAPLFSRTRDSFGGTQSTSLIPSPSSVVIPHSNASQLSSIDSDDDDDDEGSSDDDLGDDDDDEDNETVSLVSVTTSRTTFSSHTVTASPGISATHSLGQLGISKTSKLPRTPTVLSSTIASTMLKSPYSSASPNSNISNDTAVVISPTRSDWTSSSFSVFPNATSASCKTDATGTKDSTGMITWNMTEANSTSWQQCPYGPLGNHATRKCVLHMGVAKWSDVDDKNCTKRPFCSARTTGEKFDKGILNWPRTPVEERVEVQCPYEVKGPQNAPVAFRWCKINSTTLKHGWTSVNNQDCAKLETKNMTMDKLIQMDLNEWNEEEVAIKMNYLTSHSDFSEDIVKDGADLLEKIVKDATNLSKITNDLFQSVSHVMDGNSSVIAAAHEKNKSAAKILTNIEKIMETIDLSGKKYFRANASNVVAEAWDLANCTETFSFGKASGGGMQEAGSGDSSTSISLPVSLLKLFPRKRVSFVNFMNDKLFPMKEQSAMKFINSEIISASIRGQKVHNLSEPVVIDFRVTNPKYSRNCTCVYWNFEANNGFGAWSDKGCVHERLDDQRARCKCYHLTHFGILVDLLPGQKNGNTDELILEGITFVGCYLSIVGLVLTMTTLLCFKQYRGGISGKLLLNLCLALLFSLVVFVVGIERVEDEYLCVTMAALLHYFVLVAVLWMGAEAFHMFVNIVLDRLPGELGTAFVLKCAVVAWVVPMLVVLTTVLVRTEDYKNEQFCRVSGASFYIAFLGPTLTILLFNFIIFILVINTLLSNNIQASRRSLNVLHFRRVLGVMTVFGITWMFGVLAVGDLRIVFQYLFCISNTFQGFMIFVIYCLTDRGVRERLIRFLCVLPDHDSNRIVDSSSMTQRPTDIEIEMSDFEPRSTYDRSSVDARQRHWSGTWPATTHEPSNRAWVIPDDPSVPYMYPLPSGINLEDPNIPYIYPLPPDVHPEDPDVRRLYPLSAVPIPEDASVPYMYPATRPRVNVSLPGEPGPSVDNLVGATFKQPGLVLEHSGGETSLRSADGSIVFINNGHVVDVPKYPSGPKLSRSDRAREINHNRLQFDPKTEEILISPETSSDLKRWSEMGWLPKLKRYSQTLPDEIKQEDELDGVNLSHFINSAPRRSGTAPARRRSARAEQPVRVMADDDVEHAYYNEYRNEFENPEEIASNFLAASTSVSAARTSSAKTPASVKGVSSRAPSSKRRGSKAEQKTDDGFRPKSDSSASETSSNSSLRWSEADWLPSLKSYSQTTFSDAQSEGDVGNDNMRGNFQEFI